VTQLGKQEHCADLCPYIDPYIDPYGLEPVACQGLQPQWSGMCSFGRLSRRGRRSQAAQAEEWRMEQQGDRRLDRVYLLAVLLPSLPTLTLRSYTDHKC